MEVLLGGVGCRGAIGWDDGMTGCVEILGDVVWVEVCIVLGSGGQSGVAGLCGGTWVCVWGV